MLRIVLDGIPEPSAITSLEEILRFRQDPENRSRMLGLRRWVQTLIANRLPAREVTEELEWLVHQYEEYMRLQKMKVNRGVVEFVITAVAEAAEDLVKIRWGKLSKLPFSLSHRKIALMEAELQAPGREIAYVIQARKAFSP